MVWICHHILHFRINCTVGLYNDTAWATRSNVIYSDTMVLPEHQRRFFLVFCRQVSLGVWVENEIPNPFTWMPRTCAPEATSLADWYLMLTVPCNLVSSSTPYRNSLSGIWNKNTRNQLYELSWTAHLIYEEPICSIIKGEGSQLCTRNVSSLYCQLYFQLTVYKACVMYVDAHFLLLQLSSMAS